MADNEQPQQSTHPAYSAIRREGQDDFWLNLGMAFPHKDEKDFNIMLQAFPLDGKIVCRKITGEEGHRTCNWLRSQRPPAATGEIDGCPDRSQGRRILLCRNCAALRRDVYVSLTAMTVDGEEPQLLNQEIDSRRGVSIDDVLSVIKSGLTSST